MALQHEEEREPRSGSRRRPARAARKPRPDEDQPISLTGEDLGSPEEHLRASRADMEPLFRDPEPE